MGFFKRLKLWNRKTGVIRGILKCLVPCVRQTSRSASPEISRSPSPERIINENKTKENCQETSYRRTRTRDFQIESGSQQEHINFWEIKHRVEKFWRRMLNVVSPRRSQFDDISFGETVEVCRREGEALHLRDFKKIKVLGVGTFGKVILARMISKGSKSCSKGKLALKIVPNYCVSKVEKKVFILATGHPFLVQLVTSFHTEDSLCYVMEYLEGGTLQSLLSRLQRFHENVARFYAAEIILAVKYLHSHGIVHRDIKPMNILLDKDGHCKLADFGVCEVGMFPGSRIAGFNGTYGYMAPEILQNLLYGTEVDWWSVGCVMQDMMVGKRLRLEVFYKPEYPKILTRDALSMLKGVRLDLRDSFVENWL